MPIKKIQLHNIRCFDQFLIEPGTGMNFIVGPNGSGKSTLLEAISILSTGRSFRASSLSHVIQKEKTEFTVNAHISTSQGVFNMGFQRGREHSSAVLSLNGKHDVKQSELAKIFPVKLLCVDNYQLLRDEPNERRALLDWGVFHVEHSFYPAWQQYQRLLKQRNAMLKAGAFGESLNIWTVQLAEVGEIIHEARGRFIEAWIPYLVDFFNKLLPGVLLSVEYRCGWAGGSFLRALDDHLQHDKRIGFTQTGPHRADLVVQLDSSLAKHRLSLGQQKLLVAGLHLSQAKLLMECAKKETIFLLDDLPAELDSLSQSKIGAVLSDLKAQTFISCVDEKSAMNFGQFESISMFHVEHQNTNWPEEYSLAL